jgi:2-furoate---CoA ligase
MLDLGTSFLASVARDPQALAIVDGDVRLTYAAWFRQISALVAGFDELELEPGDHLVTVLQNRWEAATVHWACQFAGIIVTPVNWRVTADELDYLLADAEAKALVYEPVSTPAVAGSKETHTRPRIAVGIADTPDIAFDNLISADAEPATARVGPEAWSVMLYTSGTTARPKGVPRRHRAERAAAVAHVAQNLYAQGERTLGVMPLYHTMGIHALTSMAAVNGCFVCQPEWSSAGALHLIAGERLTALYLIPTLFWELTHAPELARSDVSSVRKLAYAGAPMLAPLTEACAKTFDPDVFVNHYGSTEIYTFSIFPDVRAKPGCAGRPGIHSALRVVVASAERRVGPDELAPVEVKGEIIASLESDEAFAGYWKRPDADARALREGWYFTGDMGWIDADGDLWVAGRVDDMIISGGENIHPVEVEDVLVRHAGVRDVAVIGEPDEKWGERVVAFVVPAGAVTAEALDEHCRSSGDLASFKRPRRFVFVTTIPKTASGKILRRLLRDGQFTEVRP